MSAPSWVQLIGALMCSQFLLISCATTGDKPTHGRSATVQGITPTIKDISGMKITSMDRNIQIPIKIVDRYDEVPVYRAEAEPSARLKPSGVQGKHDNLLLNNFFVKTKPISNVNAWKNEREVSAQKLSNPQAKEVPLYVSFGNPSRTEEFAQQSRTRETKDYRAGTRELRKKIMNDPKTSNAQKTKMATVIIRSRNHFAFDADGQTVKHSSVPASSAVSTMLKAVSEGNIKKGSKTEVTNVDDPRQPRNLPLRRVSGQIRRPRSELHKGCGHLLSSRRPKGYPPASILLCQCPINSGTFWNFPDRRETARRPHAHPMVPRQVASQGRDLP